MSRASLPCLLAAALAMAPAPAPAAVPAVVAGPDYTLALDKDGKVYSWGRDGRGQLASGRLLFSVLPRKVEGVPPVIHVDGGALHVAAVDWLGQVWTWGHDSGGQLGPRSLAEWTRPGRVLDVSGVTRVSASPSFTLALRSNGEVLVWGTFAGALREPQLLAGLAGIVDVRSGDGHVVALKSDGTVWTAGTNAYGELGDGTTGAARANAAQVAGLEDIVKIAAGACGSAALARNGTVYAWGRAACLPAPAAARATPAAVAGLANAIDLAGGRHFSHAVLANGTVMQWDNAYTPVTRPGFLAVAQVLVDTREETIARLANDTVVVMGANHLGQHAQGNTDPIPGLSLVGSLVNVTGIATAHSGEGGVTHYARRSNGELYAWGANFEGQLGDGAAVLTGVPRAVGGLPAIERLAAGESSAYAVSTAGEVWAWGDNAGFVLGDGSETPRSAPVKVPGLSGVKDVAAGRGFVLFLMDDGTVRGIGSPLAASTVPAPPVAVPGLTGVTALAARGQNAFALRAGGLAVGWGRGEDGLVGDGTTVERAAPVPIAFDAAVTQVSVGRRHALARTADGAAWSWGTDDGAGVLGDGVAGAHARLSPARIAGLTGVTRVAAGSSHSAALVAGGAARSWGSVALGDGAAATRNVPGPVQVLAGLVEIAAGDFVSHAIGGDGLVYAWGGGALRATPQGTFGSPAGDGTFVHRALPVAVLRAGAQGNLDSADWLLDLDSTVQNVLPASLVPGIVPVARAALAPGSVSLSAGVNYRAADYGRKLNAYIVGYVPPAFLTQVAVAMEGSAVAAMMKAEAPVMVQLTPAGWTTVESHLVAYGQFAPSGNGAPVDILDGVNPAVIAGARFCVGYGESGAAMLAAGAIAEVLAIEGAVAPPSAVPCTPVGVYVDGAPVSVLGTPAAFQAAVVGNAPGGTVQFRDGFGALGTPVTLTAAGTAVARASLTTSSLALGAHSIGADYAGDTRNAAAGVLLPMLHTVSAPPGGSSVSLSGPASAPPGEESIFTVVVAASQPTGTVQFYDGTALLGSPVPLVGSVATFRTAALAPGPHTIAASYSGDAFNTPRVSNAIPHLVGASLPRVSLAADPALARLGTPVKLTATVTGNGPTGPVRFADHGLDFGESAMLENGRAQGNFSTLAAGSHLLTATYAGDASNPAATSRPLVLNVKLEADTTQGTADADGDGIPNAVEAAEGRNPVVKDNDIFGNARLFAMQQYRDFLGREGDPGGVTFWASQLASGAQTRAQMVETYFNSPEFQARGAPLVRLYFAYFLRIPDYGGLQYWIGQFRSGLSLVGISNAFANSPEFVARYGTLNNSAFVERVYANVLGRLPDNAGLSYWLAQLNSLAITRGEMMVAFSESLEYRGIIASEVYVTMMYVGMLRRSPDAGGFAFWVGYRDQGKSGLDLIEGFLASAEYRGRFLP